HRHTGVRRPRAAGIRCAGEESSCEHGKCSIPPAAQSACPTRPARLARLFRSALEARFFERPLETPETAAPDEADRTGCQAKALGDVAVRHLRFLIEQHSDHLLAAC